MRVPSRRWILHLAHAESFGVDCRLPRGARVVTRPSRDPAAYTLGGMVKEENPKQSSSAIRLHSEPERLPESREFHLAHGTSIEAGKAEARGRALEVVERQVIRVHPHTRERRRRVARHDFRASPHVPASRRRPRTGERLAPSRLVRTYRTPCADLAIVCRREADTTGTNSRTRHEIRQVQVALVEACAHADQQPSPVIGQRNAGPVLLARRLEDQAIGGGIVPPAGGTRRRDGTCSSPAAHASLAQDSGCSRRPSRRASTRVRDCACGESRRSVESACLSSSRCSTLCSLPFAGHSVGNEPPIGTRVTPVQRRAAVGGKRVGIDRDAVGSLEPVAYIQDRLVAYCRPAAGTGSLPRAGVGVPSTPMPSSCCRRARIARRAGTAASHASVRAFCSSVHTRTSPASPSSSQR